MFRNNKPAVKALMPGFLPHSMQYDPLKNRAKGAPLTRQGEKWHEPDRFCERKSVNELDGESRCTLDTELSIDTQTSGCLVSVQP